MKEFPVGKTASRSMTVLAKHTAVQVGSGTVEVLATPAVAALMEGAASDLAQTLLDEAFTTVGTRLSIEHMAPTPLGAQVTATATLTGVEGRVYRFDVAASDAAGVIARGTHERVSVKQASFADKAKARLETESGEVGT